MKLNGARSRQVFVALSLLCSVEAAATRQNSSTSGSGSDNVEFLLVGNGSGSQWQTVAPDTEEIRFPNDSKTGSGDVVVRTEATSSEGSGDLGIIVSPVVTAPLLVLKEMEATSAVPSSGSKTKKVSANNSISHGVSGSNGDASRSMEPVEELHGVPSNPSLVNAVAFDGRAAVTWKAPDDDGLDPIVAYEVGWFDEEDNVLIGTQRVASSSVNLVGHVGANASASTALAVSVPASTVVEPLVNGRSYTFKVRAQNVNGYSVWSAKSLAVSPLHPPDLCERLSCSGHGTCFPNYHNDKPGKLEKNRQTRLLTRKDSSTAIDEYSLDAVCICRPGYSPPDCSAKSNDESAQRKAVTWAVCYDTGTNQNAPSEDFCTDPKPSITDICNGIECGSKRVVVQYEVEMSYEEVLFSPTAREAFEHAFTTEVASALQIAHSRLEITALEHGSIVVFFQILPASRVGEKSLNDIVENLQNQLRNETSTLRSMGTFARRIEANGAKLSFSIADQTVAGGAEDISVAGLIGTMLVLAFFVSMFGWFLRRRHYRLLKDIDDRKDNAHAPDMEATSGGMKRMHIRSTDRT
ncbi:Gastric triacylglycerol lipase [Phytophthora nicotianae]|uniref:Gastric triacylglycerol lipase n=1 Tax=Phytophthora nicotianae TaxID=4792 RepID=A0A0W8DLK1_PHYNI|nr:Gastric triacylglycerol lipase [Phytophthora nicotianae]